MANFITIHLDSPICGCDDKTILRHINEDVGSFWAEDIKSFYIIRCSVCGIEVKYPAESFKHYYVVINENER